MKRLLILLAIIALVASPAMAKNRTVYKSSHYVDRYHDNDRHVSLDIEDGSVIIVAEDDDEMIVAEMEITEDHELYIDGRKIETTPQQKKLLVEYRELVFGIEVDAKHIGIEGAKIGLAGAKLGLTAIGRVFKMFVSSYDSDDLERDMERDAEKIEARAEELEDWARSLERMADDLEELHWELEEEIPEVRELRLF